MITKEDYEEPRCPLCALGKTEAVPVGRILEKLDAYLDRKDFSAAERHLAYWLSEARNGNDVRGELTLLCECVGFYRKLGQEQKALSAVRELLPLTERPEIAGTVSAATALLNAATAYKAFGRADDALPLYEQARARYEADLSPDDERLGGLYNNMALALCDLERFDEAEILFRQALAVMERQTHGECECAVTFCNLADLAAARSGYEAEEAEILSCLDRAAAYLRTEGLPHDGRYAFTCEKCAPVFGYYGLFLDEADFRQDAERYYRHEGT